MDTKYIDNHQLALFREYHTVAELVIKLLDRDSLLRGKAWLQSENVAAWMPAVQRAALYWTTIHEVKDSVSLLRAAATALTTLHEKMPDFNPPDDLSPRAIAWAHEAEKEFLEHDDKANVSAQPVTEVLIDKQLDVMFETAAKVANCLRHYLDWMKKHPTDKIYTPEVRLAFGEFFNTSAAAASAMQKCDLANSDSNFKAVAKELLASLHAVQDLINKAV